MKDKLLKIGAWTLWALVTGVLMVVVPEVVVAILDLFK